MDVSCAVRVQRVPALCTSSKEVAQASPWALDGGGGLEERRAALTMRVQCDWLGFSSRRRLSWASWHWRHPAPADGGGGGTACGVYGRPPKRRAVLLCMRICMGEAGTQRLLQQGAESCLVCRRTYIEGIEAGFHLMSS